MVIKSIIIFCIGISLLSCEKASTESTITDELISNELWINATDIYLPVTAEWINRAEVVDLNGDNLLDLLSANSCNYSDPDKLESSHIFINKGQDTKYEDQKK